METLDREYIFRVTSGGVQDANGDVDVCFVSTGEKIVRCRNCQYYNEFTILGRTNCLCRRNENVVRAEPNGYCNFGIEEDD